MIEHSLVHNNPIHNLPNMRYITNKYLPMPHSGNSTNITRTLNSNRIYFLSRRYRARLCRAAIVMMQEQRVRM